MDDPYIEHAQQVIDAMPVDATIERIPVQEGMDPVTMAMYRITSGDRTHDFVVALTAWDDDPLILAHQERAFRAQIAGGIWGELIEEPLPEVNDAEPGS